MPTNRILDNTNSPMSGILTLQIRDDLLHGHMNVHKLNLNCNCSRQQGQIILEETEADSLTCRLGDLCFQAGPAWLGWGSSTSNPRKMDPLNAQISKKHTKTANKLKPQKKASLLKHHLLASQEMTKTHISKSIKRKRKKEKKNCKWVETLLDDARVLLSKQQTWTCKT